MGLMKKAAAALGFRDSVKARKSQDSVDPAVERQPVGSVRTPQPEVELPSHLRLALISNDSTASPALTSPEGARWAARSSADGRLGTLLGSSLLGMGMTLDSPGNSSTGTPAGPTCTGGGHGEAPPSVGGSNISRPCAPTLRQANMHQLQLLGPMCNATATPLARQVATRALRKAGDSAPISLPSITSLAGSAQLRGTAPPAIQVPGVAADCGNASSPLVSPSSAAGPSPCPRPPVRSPSATGYGPSPRMRRSTTLETHAESDARQYVAISAAAAVASVGGVATSPSAISADVPAANGDGPVQQEQQLPYGNTQERFSRLASLQIYDLSYGSPEQVPEGGTGDGGSSMDATLTAEAASSNSVPLCPLRFEDSSAPPSSATAAVRTAAAAAAATAAAASNASAVAHHAVMPGGGGAANPTGGAASAPPGSRAAGPRHSSTSQLSFHSHALVPYSHLQPAQGRLPPRRVSDYSMLPAAAPPDSTLPKLKSVASAMAAASASAMSAAVAALKASEVTIASALPAAAAAAPSSLPLPTAVAVTSLAEKTAAAAAEQCTRRPKSMRCFNLEPLQQPANGASGDGTVSGSGAAPSSGAAVPSGVGRPNSAATALAGVAAAAAETTLPSSKCPINPSEAHPQPHKQHSAKLPHAHRSEQLLAASQSSSGSPCSTAAPVAGSGSPPTAASFPSPSPSPSPVPSPFMTAEPDLPSRPASPAGGTSVPRSPSPPSTPSAPSTDERHPHPHPQRLSVQEQDSRSPLDEFVPRPLPAQGLLHFSANAPVQMLRAPISWGVSDYKVVRKLYAGYASSVYKACCLYSGSDVVLKAYNLAGLSTFLRNQVLRELDIHSRLRHPGVVHLMAAFREGDLLLLVLEYVRGGSLDRVRRKLGGRMTEFQAMHLVLLPLLGVLAHLHERGIVHRDIKPENLLFTESWQLKLCDYGVSICIREERAVTRTGSREYMAPEVSSCPLKHLPEDNKDNPELSYGTAVDVWSLGSLMYELLVGFTPFPGGPPARREGARGSAGARLAFPGGISQEARAFIRDCLELEPADRPTVHQLMEHAWVQEALVDAANGPEGALLAAEERLRQRRCGSVSAGVPYESP